MPQFTLICTDEDSKLQQKNLKSTILTTLWTKLKTFLKGVGYCFEELHTQVYPVPDSDADDYVSVYRDVD